MSPISIFISSCGRIPLLKSCLESIDLQSLQPATVVVGVPSALQTNLRACLDLNPNQNGLSSRLQIVAFESERPHWGRNWALKNMPEGLLYFLDEDVSLPDPRHLALMQNYHRALPEEILGGYYLTSPECSSAGKAYNEIANLWLKRHGSSEAYPQGRDFVVAGNFSLKLNRATRSINFCEVRSFGGEEIDFLKRHHLRGHRSRLLQEHSVYHHSRHDFITFFRRAWLHGTHRSDTRRFGISDIWLSLKTGRTSWEKFLIYSYLACTRAAQLKRTSTRTESDNFLH